MFANYHTHTPRCGHASGTEREYIERALEKGLSALGFSDHAPYFFEDGHYSNFRMYPDQAAEYVQTVQGLAEEYKGKIDVLAGFEIEYYPKLFHRTASFLAETGCDYFILGQHFLGSEEVHCFQPTTDPQLLDSFVSHEIEAMETGMFAYIAHSDVFFFVGDERVYEKQSLRLCEAAKKLNVPLEINILGLREGRQYPHESFFKIAAAVGNEVVIGCDAHHIWQLADEKDLQMAAAFAEKCGVKPVELTPERMLMRKGNIR